MYTLHADSGIDATKDDTNKIHWHNAGDISLTPVTQGSIDSSVHPGILVIWAETAPFVFPIIDSTICFSPNFKERRHSSDCYNPFISSNLHLLFNDCSRCSCILGQWLSLWPHKPLFALIEVLMAYKEMVGQMPYHHRAWNAMSSVHHIENITAEYPFNMEAPFSVLSPFFQKATETREMSVTYAKCMEQYKVHLQLGEQ